MNNTEEVCQCVKVDVAEQEPILSNGPNDSSSANNHNQGHEDFLSQDDDDGDDMSVCSSITSSPKKLVNSEPHVADTALSQLINGEGCPEPSNEKLPGGTEYDYRSQNSDGAKSPAKPTTPNRPNIASRESEDLLAQTNYNLIKNRLQELYKKCKGNPTPKETSLASQLAFCSQRSTPSCKPEKRAVSSQLPAHSGQYSEKAITKFPDPQQMQSISTAYGTSNQPANEELDEDDIVAGSVDSEDIDVQVSAEDFDWSDGFENLEVEEEVKPIEGTSVKGTEEEDNAIISELPTKEKQPRQKISDYFKKTSKIEKTPISSETLSFTSNSLLSGVENRAQKVENPEMYADINSGHSDLDQMNSSTDSNWNANNQKDSSGMQNRQSHSSFKDKQSQSKMLKPVLTEGRHASSRRVEFHSQSGLHGFDNPERSDANNIHQLAKPTGRNVRPGSSTQMLKPVLTGGSRSYVSPQKPKNIVAKRQLLRETAFLNPGGNLTLGDGYQNSRDSSSSEMERRSTISTSVPSQITGSGHEYQPLKPILTDSGVHSSQTRQKLKQTKPTNEMMQRYPGNESEGTTGADYDVSKPKVADPGQQNRDARTVGSAGNSHTLKPIMTDTNSRLYTTRNKVVTQKRAKAVVNDQTPESKHVGETSNAEHCNEARNIRNVPRKIGNRNQATEDPRSFDSEDSSPEASNANGKHVGLAGKAQENNFSNKSSQKSQNMKLRNSQLSQESELELRRSTRLSSIDPKPNLIVHRNGTSPISSEESDWDSEGSDPDFQSPDIEKRNRKPKTTEVKGQGPPPSQNLPSHIPVSSLANLSSVQVQRSKPVPKNGGNGSNLETGSKKIVPKRESESASQKQDVSSQKKAEAAVRHLPGIQIQRSKPVQSAVKNCTPLLSPDNSNNSQEKVTMAKSALRQNQQSFSSQQATPTGRKLPGQEMASRQNVIAASVRHLPGIQVKQVRRTGKCGTPLLSPEGSECDLQRSSADFSKSGTFDESLELNEKNQVACQQQLQTDIQELTSPKNAIAAASSRQPGIQVKQVRKAGKCGTPVLSPEGSESNLQESDMPLKACQPPLQTDGNLFSTLQSHLRASGNPASSSQNYTGGDFDDGPAHHLPSPEQDGSTWNSSAEQSHFDTSGEVGQYTPEPKLAPTTPNGMDDSSAGQRPSGEQIQHANARNSANTPQSLDGQSIGDKPYYTTDEGTNRNHSEISNKPTPHHDVPKSHFDAGKSPNENGSFDSLEEPNSYDNHSNQDTSVMSDASSDMSIPAKRSKKALVKSIKKNASKNTNDQESGTLFKESNVASGPGSSNKPSRPKKPLGKKGSGNGGKISPKNNQVQVSDTRGLPSFQESFPSVPSANLGRASQSSNEESTSLNQNAHTIQENTTRPLVPPALLAKKTNLLDCDTDSNDSFDVMRRRKENETNHVIPESEDSSSNQMAEVFPAVFEESPPRPLAPVAVADGGSVEMTPEKSYVNLESGEKTYTNLGYPRIPKPPQKPKFKSSRIPMSSHQSCFSNGDFQGAQSDMLCCVLCPQRFGSAGELEAHAAAEGHVVCSASASCADLRFDSPASLAHHQHLVHQQLNQQSPAVLSLSAQVERLPQAFGGYPPPQMNSYDSPSSNSNGPKQDSQIALTEVPAAGPPPAASLPKLPAGIQLTKRPAPSSEASHSPSKVSRGGDGLPQIRLPGSITLLKSQPAPQNNMADILANQGTTMVSSGSRGNQAVSIQPPSPAKRLPSLPASISISSPSKRLPNLPASISISSPCSQSSTSNAQKNVQAQPFQRFARPPAPPIGRRSSQVSNTGSIDLTRDNGSRVRGHPPVTGGGSPKRVSCIICDKVFPNQESLRTHMTFHGTQGRFMCEICRVVYPKAANLAHHKKTVHAVQANSEAAGPEFVIPICDVNQLGVKQKLLQCGIRHIVQLSSLRNSNDTATFGLPIIPIDLTRNEAFSRLDDLGSSNILSLGTLTSIAR